MNYAWIITRDHLERDEECEGHESTSGPIGNVTYCDGTCKPRDRSNDATVPNDDLTGGEGVMGPRDALDYHLELLKAGSGDTFELRDDDGILYYTGRCIADDPDDEEACFGPLRDYGAPNAGCTSIRWPGLSHRDIG